MSKRIIGIIVIIAALIAALTIIGVGVATASGAFARAKPATVIDSPASNSQYHAGEPVAVQSTSTDSAGISRVQLAVDGVVVRTDSPPQPQSSFTVIQTWQATEGTHVIAVTAFDTANQPGRAAEISVDVLPAPAPAPA